MNFRSVSQMSSQLVQWSKRLPPEIEVIVGVPRSGLLAANLLALYRNLPVADVEGLVEGRCLANGITRPLGIEKAGCKAGRSLETLGSPRDILVVDDSVFQGRTMGQVRDRIELAKLPHRIRYAAVYVAPDRKEIVDFYCEELHLPRVFEWNVLHHSVLADSCLDMDGVLCHDPEPRDNDDGKRYLTFLQNARPLLRPTSKIGWIVTSRLEKYRAETEAWLDRNNIEYGKLVMLEYSDELTRRHMNTHSAFKADVYRETGAELFFESSLRQAIEIANYAAKDVLCTDTMQMVRPGASPSPRWLVPERDIHVPSFLQRLRRVVPSPVRSTIRQVRKVAGLIP